MNEINDVVKDEYTLEAHYNFVIVCLRTTCQYVKDILDTLNKDRDSPKSSELGDPLSFGDRMDFLTDYLGQA